MTTLATRVLAFLTLISFFKDYPNSPAAAITPSSPTSGTPIQMPSAPASSPYPQNCVPIPHCSHHLERVATTYDAAQELVLCSDVMLANFASVEFGEGRTASMQKTVFGIRLNASLRTAWSKQRVDPVAYARCQVAPKVSSQERFASASQSVRPLRKCEYPLFRRAMSATSILARI